MHAYRIETAIEKDGSLTLDKIPFHQGDVVEVIILESAKKQSKPIKNKYPLRGSPIEYKDPTDPVGDNDWEALK